MVRRGGHLTWSHKKNISLALRGKKRGKRGKPIRIRIARKPTQLFLRRGKSGRLFGYSSKPGRRR